MIDRYKINMIVERIKLSSFEFETDEIRDNLYFALAQYGYADVELTDEENQLLTNELLPLAEQYEFREAEHLAFQENKMLDII